MKSGRKHKKQDKGQNDLIISEDIGTTESYAGLGQHNIVTNDDNFGDGFSNIDIQTSLGDKSKIYEHNFFSDFKVSPELEFNLPSKDGYSNNLKKIPSREKHSNPTSAKPNPVKPSSKITALPALNHKKSIVERYPPDLKSKSINDQIEKIEHRKKTLTMSERKGRMKEIMQKGRQNWSNFKSDIDFIKSIETNTFIPLNETAGIIKDEKLLNSILNELSSEDTPNAEDIIVHANEGPQIADIVMNPLVDVDNQENLIEFKSKIVPMSKAHSSAPIIEDVAMNLKNIVFNSTCRSWGAEWYRQNFEFHPIESNLPFALIQRMEGPNSVLSVVQAEFISEALFHCDISMNWTANVKRYRNTLLAFTLSRIISRCRASKTDNHQICLLDVKLKGRNIGSVRPDGITECIVIYQISTKEELQEFILHHITQFTDTCSPGLILLVISCLLTHGLPQCLQELKNDSTRLVSPLGFPRDELMLLLMCGRITSHYFNDTLQTIDDSGNYETLYGLPFRSSVGFLSTDIHCQYCKEIGTYLKTPKYPVWIAKLEGDNYAIMYCLNGNLVNDWKTEIKFQLNLYSPLFSKKGVLKMIIDSSACQSDKSRMLEEAKKVEREQERRNKEITNKRLKNMSDTALKFLLDNETIDDYLNESDAMAQTKEELNVLEKIILLKWPKAHILLDEEPADIFSLIKN